MIELLKAQKNSLFRLIKESKFNPLDFKLDKLFGDNNEVIGWHVVYFNKNYYFRVYIEQSSFGEYTTCIYSPGYNFNEERTQEEGIKPATFQYSKFRRWLTNLKDELEEIDEWENLKNMVDEFRPILFGHEIPKDPQFVQNIVDEIIDKLPESKLNSKVIQQITINLHQTTIIYRQNKEFDWLGYVIGTITSVGITMFITPDQGKSLLGIVVNAFKKLLGN